MKLTLKIILLLVYNSVNYPKWLSQTCANCSNKNIDKNENFVKEF